MHQPSPSMNTGEIDAPPSELSSANFGVVTLSRA
jgi:hypothetical protein